MPSPTPPPPTRGLLTAEGETRLTTTFLNNTVSYITINGIESQEKGMVNPTTGAKLMHWRINLVWFQDELANLPANQRKATGVVYDTLKDGRPTVRDVWVEMRSKTDQGNIHSRCNLAFETPALVPGRSRSAALTPKKFNDLLAGLKHFHYENSALRSGCLHWIQIALKDLADAGYVARDAPTRFKTDLATWRAQKQTAHPTLDKYWIPIDQGSFPHSNPTNPAA